MKCLISILILAVLVGQSITSAAEERHTVKVGVVLGLTGGASAQASYGRRAIELAAEDFQRASDLKIELVWEDSQTNPASGVAAFTKLVTVDKVDAVIGDAWAFLTEPLLPLAERHKVPLLAPIVVDTSISTRTSSYFYTLGPRATSLRSATEQFMDLVPQPRTAAILCIGDQWGESYRVVWEESVRSSGLRVLWSECHQDFQSSYRNEIIKLKTLSPMSLFLADHPDQLLQRRAEFGLNTQVLTTNHLVSALFVRHLAPALAENVYFLDWPATDSFRAAFINKYGEAPLMQAQNFYDALHSIVLAVRDNPSLLQETLRTIQFDGVSGHIDFSHPGISNSVNENKARLYQVVDGKITEVKHGQR